jgi:glycosyltransferase involved in cell wall biosynthesis
MNASGDTIKLIHVITRFDKGGSAENTFLTVRDLDKSRYDVTLIRGLSRESQMGDREARAVEANLAALERSGVGMVAMPELVRELSPLNDFRAFMHLFRLFRKQRPRIVHTHTSKAGMLGRWAAFFAGVPIVIHTPHGHVFWGYFGKGTTALFILLERWTARITDRIIALTKQEMSDHLRFSIAPAEKFTVVHSGVDLGQFSRSQGDATAVRENLAIPQGSFVVGTAGRLTPVKGHRHLIEAAAGLVRQHRDMLFVFLGDGELMSDLKEMASAMGIGDQVKFLGWRPDVAEVMSTFDVFVLPSLNEGMGKVLVEAMAMGKPLIASDVGGIPDLVVQGENGLLVPPADSKALAQAVLDLYENPDKRRRMGEAGKRISAAYGVEAMLQKIDELYQACQAERA